jgi:uncharacterized protein YaaQ
MSEELKNEKDESNSPFGNSMTTAEFTKAMDAILAVHEKRRAEERHKANSAQQKAVGILSLEQLKISDRITELATAQGNQEKRLGVMETKLDTVIQLAKSNGQKTEEAAVKSDAAAKTSGKTFYEQRVAIVGALGTLVWYIVEYFNKHP